MAFAASAPSPVRLLSSMDAAPVARCEGLERMTFKKALLVGGLVAAPAFAAPPPSSKHDAITWRADVTRMFGGIACADAQDDRPMAAWKAGLFDAQLDGRRADLGAGRAPTLDELSRKGHALARVRRYLGYAAGLCKDGSGWALALPAPAPLVIDAKGKISIPKVIASLCESFRVDFAPAGGGAPRELGSILSVEPKGLGDGVLGVTCQPPRPRFQGPVLWYLAPIGRGPENAVPAAAALAAAAGQDPAAGQAARLMSWVNAIRRAETLRPLAFKKEINEEASVLAIDPTLMHDRAMLKKVGASLEDVNVRLVGEDRVKGQSVDAMAWLLWNSPRHRDLLLNKTATSAGIAMRTQGGQTLAILVFGEDKPMKTARAAKTKPSAGSAN